MNISQLGAAIALTMPKTNIIINSSIIVKPEADLANLSLSILLVDNLNVLLDLSLTNSGLTQKNRISLKNLRFSTLVGVASDRVFGLRRSPPFVSTAVS
jgi:hypothetical protein